MQVHFTTDQILRFWSRVDTSDHWGCWPWLGHTMKFGHGQITLAGRATTAHRVAYLLVYGEIPDDRPVIGHLCNRPDCCNPTHLTPCTQAENLEYMDACGRRPLGDRHYSRLHPEKLSRGDSHYTRQRPEKIRRGERSSNAKLTDVSVREIRALKGTGLTQTEIGRRFGVSQGTVHLVWAGKIWQHVS